ncbi:MAG: HAMP domain-containing histidine kinase [Cyclobacteriaceae bacterium]|nr:HAMP domain-containing histidine kinase [Cyclobacteriaceae bacterium]
MKVFDSFLNSLIPDRFKITYELTTKVRGALISQIIVGIILACLGIFFLFFEKNSLELYLNTGIGIFILSSLFLLKFFTHFESYINFVLSGGYIVLFAFILFAGGVYSDAPFWLALLITINISYTKTSHTVFWFIVVFVFIATLFYLQSNGLDFNYEEVSYKKKATTLFSFFMLLITINYSFAKINKRKNSHHLEIITTHKRLLKERDNLMSIIAHDMKSPLRRIEGLVGVFETNHLSKNQKDILSMLNKIALESTQLIDDLLEAKRFNPNVSIENINLNALIQELKDAFLPLSNKKDIRIITRGLRNKINLETSKYELKRILDNLLSNAIKFSPFDARVEIICMQNNSHTSISIQDQGPGFKKEEEEKMFQMFQKLSAQPTGGESSSGLGLSIVKNLTGILKSELKYVTQLNKGTTFTLVLPNQFPLANKPEEENIAV